MSFKENIANDIFLGLNDHQGIMLCGYEWGGDPNDVENLSATETPDVKIVFSNKMAYYGEAARAWPYDRRIIRWFELWGHPLQREGTGGDFEKCILQTNWCDTQARKMDNTDRLLDADQIRNFILHIERFQPRLILFFGSAMADALNNPIVLQSFKNVMGEVVEHLNFPRREFSGRKFRIGFQSFAKCRAIFLPHPSGSRGLQDEYIAMFAPEIGSCITDVKRHKGIAQ